MKFYKTSYHPRLERDLHKLCALILCAYGSKFTQISRPEDLYYVQHLRLQNITMKDGLVADKISARWAQHTKLPRNDERVLLTNKNTRNLSDQQQQQQQAQHAVNNQNTNSVSSMNATNITNKTIHSNQILKSSATGKHVLTRPKRKIKSKLDIMVCTFCHYIRRITGEHGCPTLTLWCP